MAAHSGLFQIRVISPKKMSVGAVVLAVRAELERQGDIARRMYEKTTRTWSHPVTFDSFVDVSRDTVSVHTYTEDWIYRMLDYGSRKKGWWIPRSGKRRLSFRAKYKAKTSPRIIGSHAGGASGAWIHRNTRIWHKAPKARQFTDEIGKRRAPGFAVGMQQAIAKGLRRAQA